jgi:hypothetical protein
MARPSSRRASKPIISAPSWGNEEREDLTSGVAPPAPSLPKPVIAHSISANVRRSNSENVPASMPSQQEQRPGKLMAPSESASEEPHTLQSNSNASEFRRISDGAAASPKGALESTQPAPALTVPLPVQPTPEQPKAVAPKETRPMSAKKGPPRTQPTMDAAPRRGRLRPPEDILTKLPSSRPNVNVFSEESHGDDDVDIIQESFFHKQDSRGNAHGALVSDMYKAKEAAEAGVQQAQVGASDSLEIQGGINLGRSKRKAKGAVSARVDLNQLQQAVQGLVQGLTPLARSMDHLQACPDGYLEGCILMVTHVQLLHVLLAFMSKQLHLSTSLTATSAKQK